MLIDAIFCNTVAIVLLAVFLWFSKLPPEPNQKPPAILRIDRLRIRLFILFASFIADLAGIALLAASILILDLKDIHHTAVVAGTSGLGVIALLQILCLLLMCLSLKSRRRDAERHHVLST